MHINLKNPNVTWPGFHLGALKKRKVATKLISHKRYRDILFQKVASGYLLNFVHDGSSKNILKQMSLHINLKHPKITRLGFNFEVPKKHKVATKMISYERYGEILFQKVASGCLVPFVQDGSSKNAL